MHANGIENIAGKMIYQGAKIITDAIHAEIDTIPTRHGKMDVGGITEQQKQGLKDGLGISKLSNDDGIRNVKIGFNGRNDYKTKTYPNGQPNALIARLLVKGTEYNARNNFVQRAVKKATAKAEAVMKKTFEENFENPTTKG